MDNNGCLNHQSLPFGTVLSHVRSPLRGSSMDSRIQSLTLSNDIFLGLPHLLEDVARYLETCGYKNRFFLYSLQDELYGGRGPRYTYSFVLCSRYDIIMICHEYI